MGSGKKKVKGNAKKVKVPLCRIEIRIPIEPFLRLERDALAREGDAPLLESVQGVRVSEDIWNWRGIYEAFVDWKLDERARAA